MADTTTERIFCYDSPRQDNAPFWALMGNRDNGCEAAMLANQWQNNPFAYMMILGMMRFMYGDSWQNGGANTEMNARFNQLSNQMSDNHNTDILNEAIKGNSSRIGELANSLNVDLRAISSGICDVRAGIQNVAGQIGYSAEKVINAANLGDMNIITALKDCCCQNKELVQRMGYENQLAQKDTLNAIGQQTYTINERLTGIANGLQKGFSDLGYIAAQNKGEIINAIKSEGQTTRDLLNQHWKDELSQALQDEKFKNSQLQQNIYFRDLVEKKGCGCNC